jgi:acyl-CoA thioester hydrolase
MKKTNTSIQIRFKDIDALGHVNNANHLSYLEYARIDFFKTVIGSNINWAEEGLILARIEIDYKMPILLTDNVFVETWCSRLGTKSFDLDYRIYKVIDSGETDLALAKSVLVAFSYKENKSVAVPESWVQKLK